MVFRRFKRKNGSEGLAFVELWGSIPQRKTLRISDILSEKQPKFLFQLCIAASSFTMNAPNATHAAKEHGKGDSAMATWQAGLPDGERILFQAALDINQDRNFDQILLVLTGRRLLEIRNGRQTREWDLQSAFALRSSVFSGLGSLKLLNNQTLVAEWAFTPPKPLTFLASWFWQTRLHRISLARSRSQRWTPMARSRPPLLPRVCCD